MQMTSSSYLLVVPAVARQLGQGFDRHAKSASEQLCPPAFGSATHLGTELLKFLAGVDMVHVPTKVTVKRSTI